MYSSEEVVETFLKFFESRDHLRIPGASLVPKDDPTLLFVNSGMAPLKPVLPRPADAAASRPLQHPAVHPDR